MGWARLQRSGTRGDRGCQCCRCISCWPSTRDHVIRIRTDYCSSPFSSPLPHLETAGAPAWAWAWAWEAPTTAVEARALSSRQKALTAGHAPVTSNQGAFSRTSMMTRGACPRAERKDNHHEKKEGEEREGGGPGEGSDLDKLEDVALEHPPLRPRPLDQRQVDAILLPSHHHHHRHHHHPRHDPRPREASPWRCGGQPAWSSRSRRATADNGRPYQRHNHHHHHPHRPHDHPANNPASCFT
jgi:hypothetical protein